MVFRLTSFLRLNNWILRNSETKLLINVEIDPILYSPSPTQVVFPHGHWLSWPQQLDEGVSWALSSVSQNFASVTAWWRLKGYDNVLSLDLRFETSIPSHFICLIILRKDWPSSGRRFPGHPRFEQQCICWLKLSLSWMQQFFIDL